MRHFALCFGGIRRAAPVLVLWLGLAMPVCAFSNIVNPSPGYLANDYLTSLDPQGFDISGDRVAVYANSNLKVYDRTTWDVLYSLGDPNYGTTYNSFVTFDPTGDSLWVGYTVGGDTNDRVYRVTNLDTAPTWTHVATFPSNFKLSFSGTTPYISGANSTIFGADSAIWRLDTSGQNQHLKVADIGGFAAGLAFDPTGNLYCVTNFGVNDKLVRFSAQQVNEGGKTLTDGQTLSSLASPGTDVAVDAVGNVLFAFNETDLYWNQLSSTLGIWNGDRGEGANYTVIGSQSANHWYNTIHTLGDVVAGGKIYLDDGGAWGQPVFGLAEISSTAAPEPSSIVLIATSLLMFIWWQRRWRKS